MKVGPIAISKIFRKKVTLQNVFERANFDYFSFTFQTLILSDHKSVCNFKLAHFLKRLSKGRRKVMIRITSNKRKTEQKRKRRMEEKEKLNKNKFRRSRSRRENILAVLAG